MASQSHVNRKTKSPRASTSTSKSKTTKDAKPLEVRSFWPPALAPGGMIEKILQKAADKALNTSLKSSIESLHAELAKLRKICQPAADQDRRAVIARLRHHLESSMSRSDVGVLNVFRGFLGRHLKIGVDEGLLHRAVSEYARHPGRFDQIMGSLIPAGIRKSVRLNRYLKCENSTSKGDAAALWAMLTSNEVGVDGVLTGIEGWDRSTGGLSGLTVLAGPPSVGKTSLAIDLSARILARNEDTCVLFFSLEARKSQIQFKFLSRDAGIPYREMVDRKLWTPHTESSLKEALRRLRSSLFSRLRVLDRMPGDSPKLMTVQEVQKQIISLLKASKTSRCVVIIDSFRNIVPGELRCGDEDTKPSVLPSDPINDDTKMRFLREIQRSVKTQAMIDGPPVLVIEQVRKDIGHRRLAIDDLLGSVQIAYEPDRVVLMEQAEAATANGFSAVTLNVAKVRDVGERGEVTLYFNWKESRFTESLPNETSSSRSDGTHTPRSKRLQGK